MRKFILKLSIFFAVCLILPVAFCVIVDPYNVFHKENIRSNEIEPNKNYIKMSYILSHPDQFESFIFGSSRVGTIHPEKIWEESCYNMTYSEGLPYETLQNLKTMLKHGIVPEKIYLGVDSLSYTLNPKDHLSKQINAPYELSVENPLSFWKLYLDPAIVSEAIRSTFELKKDSFYTDVFYSWGWTIDYGATTSYNFENALPSIGEYNLMDETLETIAEIVELCNVNHIELIVFTNPMYFVTHEASVERGYYEFLERLAQITPYINFSGYNDITVDCTNYVDASHYTAEVGDMIKECICYQAHLSVRDQGFGVEFNSANVNEWIQILENNRIAYLND